jgi:hypothetical protein
MFHRAAVLFFIALLARPAARAQPASVDIPGAPIPIGILAQSPAETRTELQVVCLFRSEPVNTLHGSLAELNEKMKGLLERVRKPDLFRGELGETMLITPPKDSLGVTKLLVIGLGESQSFSPQRMQLVGEILYAEAGRLGVAHPYFAPTILDGGVSRFATGDVAEQVVGGFLRAMAIDKLLQNDTHAVTQLTFLAGAKNVSSTREGIEKAIRAARN